MFPNPATDKVTIRIGQLAAKGNVRAELRDVTGKLVKSININKEETDVDVSEIAPGAYLLNIFSGESSKSIELIKK